MNTINTDSCFDFPADSLTTSVTTPLLTAYCWTAHCKFDAQYSSRACTLIHDIGKVWIHTKILQKTKIDSQGFLHKLNLIFTCTKEFTQHTMNA